MTNEEILEGKKAVDPVETLAVTSEKRLRILYFMHVDWGWAKQRPHFLAEFLSQNNEILVTYPYFLSRSTLVKNRKGGLRIIPIFNLPLSGKFKIIKWINQIWSRIFSFLLTIWFRPDFVWITSPVIFNRVFQSKHYKYVYDCMDNMPEFTDSENEKIEILKWEAALVKKAALVICSSGTLLSVIRERYEPGNKLCLVNNAFDPESLKIASGIKKESEQKKHRKYVLGYIGTISKWIDFQSLIPIVDTFKEVEIHLIGPVEFGIDQKNSHPGIKFYGPVAHHELPALAKNFDALIMPFLINNLILCVDPVKFYEYIYFNKPIISVFYPEIARFENFVDFYTDGNSFINIVNNYIENNFEKKYTEEDRKSFIQCNNWQARGEAIEIALHSLIKSR